MEVHEESRQFTRWVNPPSCVSVRNEYDSNPLLSCKFSAVVSWFVWIPLNPTTDSVGVPLNPTTDSVVIPSIADAISIQQCRSLQWIGHYVEKDWGI